MTDYSRGPVWDGYGNPVTPDDPDFQEQKILTAQQAEWERAHLTPLGPKVRAAHPEAEDMPSIFKNIEWFALRTAQAIELGWASPRAIDRIRKALEQMYPPSFEWLDGPRVEKRITPDLARSERNGGHSGPWWERKAPQEAKQ